MTGDLGRWADPTHEPAPEEAADPAHPAPSAPVEETAPPTYYATLDEFVAGQIIPVFRRRTGDRPGTARWAARWWENPEAVYRLEALWRAWEHLRLDPALGISTWLRDHADYHLNILFSPEGPFAASTDTSDHEDPLPHEAPPSGVFARPG